MSGQPIDSTFILKPTCTSTQPFYLSDILVFHSPIQRYNNANTSLKMYSHCHCYNHSNKLGKARERVLPGKIVNHCLPLVFKRNVCLRTIWAERVHRCVCDQMRDEQALPLQGIFRLCAWQRVCAWCMPLHQYVAQKSERKYTRARLQVQIHTHALARVFRSDPHFLPVSVVWCVMQERRRRPAGLHPKARNSVPQNTRRLTRVQIARRAFEVSSSYAFVM